MEPLISAQWFVKMEPLAKEAIRVVKDGTIKFVPERFTKTYINWMENVHDWCISRQLWWGHQIPRLVLRRVRTHQRQPSGSHPVRKCGCTHLTREEDVLDTWFSSALWPFSTLGWPNKDSEDLRYWYPHLRAGHRLRYHLLLGGPYDLLRHGTDEAGALQDGVHPRSGPG